MHRTNLYLTLEQEAELDVRAGAAGLSRSALVRRLIDRELAQPATLDHDCEAALGQWADAYHELAEGLFDDDPDLRIER